MSKAERKVAENTRGGATVTTVCGVSGLGTCCPSHRGHSSSQVESPLSHGLHTWQSSCLYRGHTKLSRVGPKPADYAALP